ncbi:hypothetical protein HMPREF0813_01042 [Streptococcus anginosus F0211]|uniref:Uncharacterized protein n=1 Tax=Streptococcus anginosus F0211 TaxID=706437 RepID=E6J1B7_STRAP|nr:hypothetical protein HMPREF0813_01042 [Streptococcus anginosus F0211]EUB20997.1 hypothetical protein HMPREF1510_1360 [Streptococcus sp. ACC21]
MLSKFCCSYQEYENKVIVTNKLQIFLKYVDFYKTKLYNDFGI